MKKILMLLIFASSLFSATKNEILNDYKNQNYLKVCLDGSRLLRVDRDDETFINAVAYSCIKMDIIDTLSSPIVLLKKSASARQNASYYATILFQKKLLYHALIDDVDISYVRTPKIDYILSKIFDMYVKKEYKKNGDLYIFKDSDYSYELNVVTSSEHKKIQLKKFKEQQLIKTYFYW